MGDYTVFMAGMKGVGKTSLSVQLAQNRVVSDGEVHEANTFTRRVIVGSEEHTVSVTDPGPEEDAKKLSTSMRFCRGFMLVFSYKSRASFDCLTQFRSIALDAKGVSSAPFVLVATHSDVKSGRQVTPEEGRALASSFGCPFLEVCSMNYDDVENCFVELVKEIMAKEAASPPLSMKKKKDCCVQ